jgi:hypothetical protein
MNEACDASEVGRFQMEIALITMPHLPLPMPENCGMFGGDRPKPLQPSHNLHPNGMISHCVYTSKRL